MATVLKEIWIDDIDGSGADRTVRFSFNGRDYELDMSNDNFRTFQDALAPYIQASRRIPKKRRRTKQ